MDGLTWANVVSLLVGVLSLAGVVAVATLQRRSERDKITKDLRVSAQTAEISAKDLNLKDEELEVRKHVWASEMAVQIGSAAHVLLGDAEARVLAALAEVERYKERLDRMDAQLQAVQIALADCEQRCAAHETRSTQIIAWARAQGWEAP